jgi:hypothetical protein
MSYFVLIKVIVASYAIEQTLRYVIRRAPGLNLRRGVIVPYTLKPILPVPLPSHMNRKSDGPKRTVQAMNFDDIDWGTSIASVLHFKCCRKVL